MPQGKVTKYWIHFLFFLTNVFTLHFLASMPNIIFNFWLQKKCHKVGKCSAFLVSTWVPIFNTRAKKNQMSLARKWLTKILAYFSGLFLSLSSWFFQFGLPWQLSYFINFFFFLILALLTAPDGKTDLLLYLHSNLKISLIQ